MNCEQVVQHMWRYLDRELDGVSSRQLERHLEQCRRCFSRVEFERQLKALVRRPCRAERVPPHLRARVRHLLQSFSHETPAT